jgi:hypothetical protein
MGCCVFQMSRRSAKETRFGAALNRIHPPATRVQSERFTVNLRRTRAQPKPPRARFVVTPPTH